MKALLFTFFSTLAFCQITDPGGVGGGGAGLPTQTAHTGEALLTDGSAAYWNPIPGLGADNVFTGLNRYTYDQQRMFCTNAGTTGTTVNRIAKLTTTTCVVATASTDDAFGVVVSGAGTAGSALIARAGKANCVFTAAAVAGNFVTAGAAGICVDTGTASRPSSGCWVGRVGTAIGGAGTTDIFVEPGCTPASSGGGGYSINVGGNAVIASPTSATTYVFGCGGQTITTATASAYLITGCIVPAAGTIKSVYVQNLNGGAGSGGSSVGTVSLYVNGNFITYIANPFTNYGYNPFSITGQSIAVAANDIVDIRWTVQTGGTPPTNAAFLGAIYIQ